MKLTEEHVVTLIPALLAFIEATVVAICVHQRNRKHEKEMQEMRLIHEKSMRLYESQQNKEIEFEHVRYQAIADYLNSAGDYLADPYNDNAYAAFRRSLSTIFMYLPENKHSRAKELNEAIDLVRSIKFGIGDGSHEMRQRLADQAECLRCQICEEFQDLGVKNPLSMKDQQ